VAWCTIKVSAATITNPGRPWANAAAPAGGNPGRGGETGAGALEGSVRQLREASASFHVVDGRMTFAALAGSGW